MYFLVMIQEEQSSGNMIYNVTLKSVDFNVSRSVNLLTHHTVD